MRLRLNKLKDIFREDSKFKVFLFEDTAALHNTMKRFPKGV